MGTGIPRGESKRRFTPWSKRWRGAGAGDQTCFTGQAAVLTACLESSSRREEALTASARGPEKPGYLSLVTSAATTIREVSKPAPTGLARGAFVPFLLLGCPRLSVARLDLRVRGVDTVLRRYGVFAAGRPPAESL